MNQRKFLEEMMTRIDQVKMRGKGFPGSGKGACKDPVVRESNPDRHSVCEGEEAQEQMINKHPQDA